MSIIPSPNTNNKNRRGPDAGLNLQPCVYVPMVLGDHNYHDEMELTSMVLESVELTKN